MTARCNYMAVTETHQGPTSPAGREPKRRPLRRDPRLPGWLGEISSLINLQRVQLLPGIMKTIPQRKLQGAHPKDFGDFSQIIKTCR